MLILTHRKHSRNFPDAMQARRPVIAMPTGDLPALLNEHGCGELAEDISASALTAALRKALKATPTNYNQGIQAALPHFDIAESAQHFAQRILSRSMSEFQPPNIDPRWGADKRNIKPNRFFRPCNMLPDATWPTRTGWIWDGWGYAGISRRRFAR